MAELAELEVESSLGVKVPNFEGPLELLLHLIKEDEINIYDIPIAKITQQYLEALDVMKSLNLTIAGDFLVMAATLIHIKSKMLLPVHETEEDEDREEGEDPRQELVARLLEYKKFKEAAEGLAVRESTWRQIFFRTPAEATASDEIYLGDLTAFDLFSALQKVIARLPADKAGLTIEPDALSVRDQINFIVSKMEGLSSLLFDQLFEGAKTRTAVVVTFLALLEVVRIGLIKIIQTEMCGPLRLVGTNNLVQKGEEDGRS